MKLRGIYTILLLTAAIIVVSGKSYKTAVEDREDSDGFEKQRRDNIRKLDKCHHDDEKAATSALASLKKLRKKRCQELDREWNAAEHMLRQALRGLCREGLQDIKQPLLQGHDCLAAAQRQTDDEILQKERKLTEAMLAYTLDVDMKQEEALECCKKKDGPCLTGLVTRAKKDSLAHREAVQELSKAADSKPEMETCRKNIQAALADAAAKCSGVQPTQTDPAPVASPDSD